MISCEKVDNILNCLFHQVYVLEDWIIRVSDVVLSDLVKPNDPSSYIQLLKTTKVCIKKSSSQRQLDNCFSPTQSSFQREIIMRVIERILRKDEKSNNVLVLGFSLQSENPNTCISKTSNIELRYPNSASNRLQYSSWELLLSRIGDGLMEYLLEMTSIFLQVSDSSCYIQVTGEGANDMTWKLKSKSLLKSSSIVHRKRKWKGKGAGLRPRQLQKKFTNVREKDKQSVEIEKFAMDDKAIGLSPCVTQNISPPDSALQTIIGCDSVNEVSLHPTKTCDENIKQSFISLTTKRKAETVEFRNSKHRKLHQNSDSANQNEKQIAVDERNSRCEITTVSDYRIAVGSRKRKMCHDDDLIKCGKATIPSSEENDFRFVKRVKIDSSSSSHTDHDAINSKPGLGKIQASSASAVNDKVQVSDTEQVGLKCNNMVDDQDVNNVENKDCKPYNFFQPLRRTSLFYCKNLCEKIPKLGDLEEVVSQVTNISVGFERDKVINFPPEVRDMFQVLLSRYKKFPWYSMLNYHCPINIYTKLLNGRERCKRRKKMRNVTTAKLLESYTTYQQVYLFLKVIIKRIIPLEMFGCQENRNVFLKNVLKFISLGKFDRLCLGEIMNGIKIKKCKWLKKISNPTHKSHVLSKLQLWFFNHFIIPIKQAFFYVTDSSNYRNRIFYYRKSLWQKIFYKAFKAFKEKSSLKLIPESEVKLLLKYEKSLGIAHLRFLPKTSSCRPIVNMGKNLLFPGINKKIPINKQLLNLLNVLSPDKLKNSDNLGSTVFGTDDVYLKLKHFIQQRKDNQDTRELYFVKTDISNCYDTIKPKKLHDIIEDILQQNPDEYITRRYFTVMSVGGKLRGTINRDSRSLMDYNPDFFSFIKDKIQEGDLRDLLLIDKVISEHHSTDNLLELLRALLYDNIIKVGRLYYKQELGISQGSVLSTLLCNYYYGRMEGESMTVLHDELMMRMVDDFIFISPYKHRAVEFLTNMWSGNVEYNCRVNAEKIVTNFTCQLENRDIQPHINQEFAWCGYIINTSTLNISVDYDRYIGLAISDTMTFETGQNPGQAMKNKLMLSIRPKCNCLLLDSKINSESTIQINIYQLFQLIAYKFQCYNSRLPYKQRASNNTIYFLEMILGLASYTYHQARSKLTRLNSHKPDNGEEFILTLAETKWICLFGFMKILSKFHSQFHQLLISIKSQMKSIDKQLEKKKVEDIKCNIDKPNLLILQNTF